MSKEEKANLLIEALKVLVQPGDERTREQVRDLLLTELKAITW